MSFPSVGAIVAAHGLTLATASEAELRHCLLYAFQKDVPLGFAHIERIATSVLASGLRNDPMADRLDPNSECGKQVSRLLGTDIARQTVEEHFGVAFGLLNCCAPACAPRRDMLNLTAAEQIALQLSPDC